jgi:acyl carrier protein
MSDEIRPEITEIFEDLFEFEGALSLATSPDNVPKWDSLKHIALVTSLEQSFDISLSMDEMHEIRTVGDIHNILERHGV